MAILTAKQGTNADLFPDVLALYAKPDDRILDMTYGRGVFWKNTNGLRVNLVTNDLVAPANHAYDCRSTPFDTESFDVVVFDPPYMHTSGTVKESIAKCYNTNTSAVFKNQKDVDAFFVAGIAEAGRLLKPKGVLLVKCQDTIESARPHWTHVKIMQSEGFRCEDLFILMQTTTPAMSSRWSKQYHARKNHSYFIVLRKIKAKVVTAPIAKENGNQMSYKDVLKIFKLERELSDDESALLNTLREMSDTDRELLAETLGPPVKAKVKETTKQQRKIEHCDIDGCGLTKRAAIHKDTMLRGFHAFLSPVKKSARASSLAEKVKGVGTRTKEGVACCDEPEFSPIHIKEAGYLGYHPFVSSSSARPAVGQSSTSGSEVSSETDSDAASNVSSATGG